MGIVGEDRRTEQGPSSAATPKPASQRAATAPGFADPRAFPSGTNPNEMLSNEEVQEIFGAAEQLRDLEMMLDRCMAGIAMHFQPIVHARTRARFGYEALLRSADRSLPNPGAILDAAERLERVPSLGRAVRAQVAKVVADAPAERGLVFVNLHVLDLADRQLVSPFAPLSKIASRVVLEITERTSLDGQIDLRYRVAELRELGFRIAIDDLGGGHARMGTFTPLDTDFVKLDMSLVRDLDKHPMKQRLVRSVIELCREQGTQVIAEGIETVAEERALEALGCDLMQGYLIAKPAAPFIDPL
jgi:EAL domain-containing protein (putative c-di-GMP-specific phosphodiesterase class I)